jgi:hypothetical protein
VNLIIPHSYYREIAQARRMAWIRRKADYRRTGITPPLVWADPGPVATERRNIINWKEITR